MEIFVIFSKTTRQIIRLVVGQLDCELDLLPEGEAVIVLENTDEAINDTTHYVAEDNTIQQRVDWEFSVEQIGVDLHITGLPDLCWLQINNDIVLAENSLVLYNVASGNYLITLVGKYRSELKVVQIGD